jgi:predicted ATPase
MDSTLLGNSTGGIICETRPTNFGAITMLTRLRIKNLKGLRDTGDMAIRPLTFFIGPNSAGKSTAIEALLMIRQTVDSRDMKNPLLIDGPYVKLNSYRDLIFRHDTENNLSIELDYVPDYEQLYMSLLHHSVKGISVSLAASFSYDSKTNQIHAERVTFETHPPDDRPTTTFRLLYIEKMKVQMALSEGKRYTFSLEIKTNDADYPDHSVIPFINWRARPSKFYTFPVKGDSEVMGDDDFAYDFAVALEEVFKNSFYIGPLRAEPRRVYVTSGETPQDVGLRGERSVDVLKSVSGDPDQISRLFKKVSHWLSKFDMALDVNLRQLTDGYFFVELTNPHTKVPVNLADTGFGGSQVLPVIVQGFYAPDQSLLMFEQPEIHLHPRSQATLGDLFIDIADDNKRLIVETHSEHMISRVQRRIAEGTVRREDVAIHYFEPNEGGTRVFEIKLNEDGQFVDDGLPENFFAEGYIESMEHLKAIASK